MSNTAPLAALLFACATLVGCTTAGDTPTYRVRTVARPVDGETLAKAGLEYTWRFKLELTAGEHVERLYRLDELVYCLTNQRRLIAVDARQGVPKWAFVIGHAPETIFDPTHVEALTLRPGRAGIQEMTRPKSLPPVTPYRGTLINTLSTLVVINRQNGKLVKIAPLDFAANTSGSADRRNFYTASASGNYYAVRMDAEVVTWEMSTGEMILSPVRRFDRLVYAGSMDRTLTAAEGLAHRKQVWRREFQGAIVAPFQVERRGLYVGTLDGRIHAIDRMTGDRLKVPDPATRAFRDWGPIITRGQIRDAPVVGERTLFQNVRQDAFYAISLDSGKVLWTNPEIRGVVAVLDGKVLAINDKGHLQMVEEATGTLKSVLVAPGWGLFVPNASLPAIFAARADGEIACIRKINAPALTARMLTPSLEAETGR